MTPAHLKRITDALSGFAIGVVAVWLLFGNPPTGALIAIIIMAGAIAWGPRLREARRRRES